MRNWKGKPAQLFCFALLCVASFRFASLRVASLRVGSLCSALLRVASLFFLGAVWERSGSVLEAFWERLGRYFGRSGGLKKPKIEAAGAHGGFISKKSKI